MLSPYILGRKPKIQFGSQKMQAPRYNNERFTIHTTPPKPTLGNLHDSKGLKAAKL